MELEDVKQVFMPEGEARKILEGETVLWEKLEGILITDFKHYRYASYAILAPAGVPEDVTPVWEVSELPAGLSYKTAPKGITISGYAERVGRKRVTVRVTLGEQTEETLYTFAITSDGNEIAIASPDLGVWYNAESGAKSGTTALSLSGSGASGSSVTYYSTGKPLWMGINSSSGALSGTPNIGYEAQSGWVTVYAIRGGVNAEGSYKTPRKVLQWRTTNSVPHFRYTNIRLDCTTALRASGNNKTTFFSLDLSQYYYPIEGGANGITYTIDSAQGKHVTPYISGNTLHLQKKSKCTTTSGCDSYITIVARNSSGASGTLYIHCDVHAKKAACSTTTVVEAVS
ncbi:MAG: hypothetical protein IJS28_07500 [Synergistaceae bacterium]|nr:hypothetical protein [Synergistaceae bacterium]